MTAHKSFVSIRNEMVRIFPGPGCRRRPAAMLVETGRFAFSGERLSDPRATVFTEGGHAEDDKGFAHLGERLLAALRERTSFRPGPEAAALLATDDGSTVLCMLFVARVETGVTGHNPTHDHLVDVDGMTRTRIGSVVGTAQEVRTFGSLLHLGHLGVGRWPGPGPQVEIPGCIRLEGGIAVAAARVPEAVRISTPTHDDLLRWSEEHYGTLPLRGGPMLPYPAGARD